MIGAADQEAVGAQINSNSERALFGRADGGSNIGRNAVLADECVLNGALVAWLARDGTETEEADEDVGHLTGVGILELEDFDLRKLWSLGIERLDDAGKEIHAVDWGGDDEGIATAVGGDE